MIYYNDIEPFACAWLRELVAAGQLPSGVIDERSIADVSSDEIRGFEQVHLFAGIGGWAYALRLAGVPDETPIWSASCPCQPLSSAGHRKGHADSRHLWPVVYRLIAECRPPTIVGEQVASRDGREWFAGIRADLEGLGYACGAADLCAAGVGAPHVRQRLYWVAHADRAIGQCSIERSIQRNDWSNASGSGDPSRLGNTPRPGLEGQRHEPREGSGRGTCGYAGLASKAGAAEWNGRTIRVECSDGPRRIPVEPALFPVADGIPNRVGTLRGAGNAIIPQVAARFLIAALSA